MPNRLRRSRARGYRMPPDAIYVGRPTGWGNPFVATGWQAACRAVALGCRGDRAGMREAAVKLYRFWLSEGGRTIPPEQDQRTAWQREVMTVRAPFPPTTREIREALRGRDLVCWCGLDEPCHADVLLEIANGEAA